MIVIRALFNFNAANSAVQYLAGSSANGGTASKVDSFTVTAADGTQKVVSFTINGTNDAAEIGTPTVSAVTEDSGVVSGNLTATGTISISDTDTGEASFSTTVASAAGNLGSLALASGGGYTYTVANAATQYLAGSNANGGTASKLDTFTVTAADGTQKVVSFTINGANDAAVIGTPTVSAVTEDAGVVGGNLTAAGSISISDVDSGEASFSTSVASAAGNLGTLVLATNGGYTYTVANAATQYLEIGRAHV